MSDGRILGRSTSRKRLCLLCNSSGNKDVVVRIVCHELESWFLGDLQAVERAFGKSGLSRLQEKSKYRNPDRLNNAAQELKKLVPEYQKLSGARIIAANMQINNNRNRSTSFQVFLEGLQKCVIV